MQSNATGCLNCSKNLHRAVFQHAESKFAIKLQTDLGLASFCRTNYDCVKLAASRHVFIAVGKISEVLIIIHNRDDSNVDIER